MSEKVHVKIIKGSVDTWKDGSFKKGETFETTREEALRIDPSFIQILEDLPKEEPPQEVIPTSPETLEAAESTVDSAENSAESPSVNVVEVEEAEESAPKKKRKKADADA